MKTPARTPAKTATPKQPASAQTVLHCAVYTRKSTEEGLDKEFTTLDAQREAAEAYIRSQHDEGWVCLPDRYDDGGFTGSSMDRPALQRLLADIAARKIDLVITYKVDRLSRSLLDFARLMERFEAHQVAFVAFTQQIHTATPMGRLLLNVLLSFAQFEREIIAERTKDKIAATRRQGKWAGGRPLLGYDLDPRRAKLHVNPAEANRVRAIFALFAEHQALAPVLRELARRGWRTKQWTTRSGAVRGGRPFTRISLYRLLTNLLYTGKVRYQGEVHPGEHPAIVEAGVWKRVQALLGAPGEGRQPDREPNRQGSGRLLQGLLRCKPCGCAMTPAFTTRQRRRRYGYYVCGRAQKRGWEGCPSKSVPAAAIEAFVVAQLGNLRGESSPQGPDPGPLVLPGFPAYWDGLASTDRLTLLHRVLKRVVYDGRDGRVDLLFHPAGLQALADQLAPIPTEVPT